MKIGGIIDISTKDIPHKSAMVIFTVGCNFKCDFCHNKYLLQTNVGREYTISELIDRIKSNLLVSGISITGGEPTLQNDLLELCREIRKIGKYLSLDTNGSNPEVIKVISPTLNRIALDLKGPPNNDKLEKITGVKINVETITKTIEFLNSQNNLDFEIRTTYVGNLLTSDNFSEIITYLQNLGFHGNFVLQQYQYVEGVGDKFKEIFSKPDHNALLNLLEPYKGIKFPFKIFLRDEIVGYCNLNELK
ncbi:MAG: anaerobic ribonucleoside-triphosphate reductase activating protein [Promethearchaeota archaeon]|jgi:pyruvate formate lyase activating enzyme